MRYLFILGLLGTLSGCASLSGSNSSSKPDLNAQKARIEMQRPSWFSSAFSDKLFGSIVSLEDESRVKLFLETNFKNNASATHFLDVAPGNYKLRVRCEPSRSVVNDYPQIWLANYTASVEAGQTLRLACERYANEKGDKEWSSYDHLLDANAYDVRLILLDDDTQKQ